MQRGFSSSAAGIRISNKKMAGSIVMLGQQMAMGASPAQALASTMMFLGKGVRGAMAGMVAAGALSFFIKKFGEAKDAATAMQQTLDDLDNGKLNAQNASVKELVGQLGKYQDSAKQLKKTPGFWGDMAELFSGNSGQRARQAAQAEAGKNNMMQQVMQGQGQSAKAAHLQATGRKKEAARMAFGVKRGSERADLEEGLKKGGANEGEMATVLGDFDAETRDQMRAMGLRRVGRKGNNQASLPFSGLRELAEKNNRTITGNAPAPTPEGVGTLRLPDKVLNSPVMGGWLKAMDWNMGMLKHGANSAGRLGKAVIGGDPIGVLREIRDAIKNAPIIKMK